MRLKKIKASFQGKGYDLRKIKGCGDDTQSVDIALEKQEALRLLKLYYNLGIPVLGGGGRCLLLKDDGEVDWTYDNWHIDRLENESDIQFSKRIIEEYQSI